MALSSVVPLFPIVCSKLRLMCFDYLYDTWE